MNDEASGFTVERSRSAAGINVMDPTLTNLDYCP